MFTSFVNLLKGRMTIGLEHKKGVLIYPQNKLLSGIADSIPLVK